MKAVMLDAGLDKAARESNVAEIASRYAALMEDTKSAADARVETNASSPLASARQIAGAVAVPLKVYGKASGLVPERFEVLTRSARGTSWRSR